MNHKTHRELVPLLIRLQFKITILCRNTYWRHRTYVFRSLEVIIFTLRLFIALSMIFIAAIDLCNVFTMQSKLLMFFIMFLGNSFGLCRIYTTYRLEKNFAFSLLILLNTNIFNGDVYTDLIKFSGFMVRF